MATSFEKKAGLFNRYVALKNSERSHAKAALRDTVQAETCKSLAEAQKGYRQVHYELNKIVTKLQDPGSNNASVKAMNDQANTLLRRLKRWERATRRFGGEPLTGSLLSSLGKGPGSGQVAAVSAPGGTYVFFGVAKQLPEARAVLADEVSRLGARAVGATASSTDAMLYFGWTEDADEGLAADERDQDDAAFAADLAAADAAGLLVTDSDDADAPATFVGPTGRRHITRAAWEVDLPPPPSPAEFARLVQLSRSHGASI